jgi:hypothetical protein
MFSFVEQTLFLHKLFVLQEGGDKLIFLSPINSPNNLGIGKNYLARGLITRESKSTFLET